MARRPSSRRPGVDVSSSAWPSTADGKEEGQQQDGRGRPRVDRAIGVGSGGHDARVYGNSPSDAAAGRPGRDGPSGSTPGDPAPGSSLRLRWCDPPWAGRGTGEVEPVRRRPDGRRRRGAGRPSRAGRAGTSRCPHAGRRPRAGGGGRHRRAAARPCASSSGICGSGQSVHRCLLPVRCLSNSMPVRGSAGALSGWVGQSPRKRLSSADASSSRFRRRL